MIRIFKLVLLLIVSQVAFGQAPSNYTNINGRYRWIAGMFDSTFHIPKGTSASLRTGGSTNAGALFFNTTDSTVYTYTGTQWIKLRGVIVDTTSLSNRINLKLNISDTAAMLAPYLRKVDTASLSNRINLKLNISDTATMLGNYLNNVGYGLIKAGQVVRADSATLATYFLRRKDSLTTTNPLGYVTRTILADTAAAIRSSATSGFVPYTGATQNVNLGQFGLTSKFVQFDTSSQAVTDRRLQWSNDDGTLQFGMTNGATITQRVGLEQFARVKNVQGSQINKGQVVYIFGASGDRASVKLADNRADSTSSRTLGVATEDIPINDVGLVGTFGVVSNLNLAAYAPGDVLYLDSIPGGLTKTKPQAPYHIVFIGVVERANAGNGQLFTNVQNGYELEELHNVRITSPVRNNALLVYDSTRSLWIDTTIAQAGLAVTQLNTNSGSGITGGPITTVGTIAADTLVLSTRAWRQKGIDSVQGNLTAGLALKLNISDTANMLLPYLRKVDTASLSNRINLKVNISDTASMLSPYLRKIDTASLSNRINLKVNISDTANMLNPYLRKVDTASLSNRINTKLNISDTATMLGNYVNNVGYGLSKVSQVVSADSATLASYFLRRKDSLTATNLLGYVTGKILADTAAAVRAAAGGGSIGGSGTTNTIAMFTGSTNIGNSIITQSTTLGNSAIISGNLNVTMADSASSLVGGLDIGNGDFGTKENARLTFYGRTYGLSAGTATNGDFIYSRIANQTGKLEWKDRIAGTLATRFSVANGKFNINNVPNATVDTDKFMVLDGDTIKYRTGAEVLSDIGAAASSSISGTTNRLAKFTASGTIGNSSIADSSSSVAMTISNAGAVIFTDTVRINTTATKGLVFQNSAGGESPNITFNTPVNKYNIDANAVGNLRIFTEKTDGTGGVVRATLDSSGNLGLGVTPSAWSVSGIMQISNTDGTKPFASSGIYNALSANLYYNAGWKYATTGNALLYSQEAGTHAWYNAISGTAGNAVTLTQAMTLNASGNLGIGTTTIGSRLQVNGNAAIGYSASTAAPTNGLAVSGNVGIGTTNVNGRLQVKQANSLDYRGLLVEDSGTPNWIGLAHTGTSGVISVGYDGAGAYHPMVFKTNDAERMRITTGGELQLKPAANTAALSTSSNYSLTGSNAQSLIDLAGTWNTTGNPTAIKLNITNTASGATANLMDLQVGGTSEFKVTKAGYVGINQGTPTSFLHVGGSVAAKYVSKTATYTLDSTDYTVVFNVSSAVTANLPDATTCTGRIYVIKVNNTTNTDAVTIDPNGAQTIDGNATYAIQCQYGIMIQSDGANWRIIADFGLGLNCL